MSLAQRGEVYVAVVDRKVHGVDSRIPQEALPRLEHVSLRAFQQAQYNESCAEGLQIWRALFQSMPGHVVQVLQRTRIKRGPPPAAQGHQQT